jgi:hypothetical protein
LKVAKWEGAFEMNGGAVQVKNNFINSDADRFFVRVTDPGRLDATGKQVSLNNVADTIRIKISTTSDVGNEVTLYEVGGVNSGVFLSTAMLLVSNSVDDNASEVDVTNPIDTKADNTLDDRTFLVKLGDKVSMEYTAGNNAVIVKKAPVPIIKDVQVHITVMTSKKVGDMGASNNEADAFANATRAQVNDWMEFAQQQYAQVGVRLVWSIDFADQPKKVDAGDDDVDLSDGLYGSITPGPEARGLIRGKYANGNPLRTASDTDVYIL